MKNDSVEVDDHKAGDVAEEGILGSDEIYHWGATLAMVCSAAT